MKTKQPIETLILTAREQRVILDTDLAELYGVPTKVFNQAVKRNWRRFPDDFAFQLSAEEWNNLKSQITTSSEKFAQTEGIAPNWSQFATASPGTAPMRSQIVTASKRNIRHLPYAFTEHGALMAANILRSERAVEMSVFVIRAFVKMREQLAANAAILKRLAEIDKTLLEHDSALRTVWTKLQPLLAPPPAPPKRRIGFQREDEK